MNREGGGGGGGTGLGLSPKFLPIFFSASLEKNHFFLKKFMMEPNTDKSAKWP